ncbi:unnamed protein product [Anisakis simplex]|uniref:E3 ubiquitin-protein ligase n=1 Tax=Anisakis simplex TaxID=6269 RepID=A0A0M3JXJ9_ANISI|nr:unnamed protein product [Anisakis simplex]
MAVKYSPEKVWEWTSQKETSDSKSATEPSKTSKADQPEPTESGDHLNSSSESPSATAPSAAPAATDGTNKAVGTSITSTDSTSQAAVMLDVPVEVDEEDADESRGDLGSTAPSAPAPISSSKPSEPKSQSSDKAEVSSSQQLRQTPTSTKSQEKAHIKEAISKGVKKIASARATDEVSIAADDCNEIVEGKSYRWKDWRLIKSRDSLFIWCDAVAVEFSDGSNGWFRFMLDGQLSTMYSSGNPESGADSAETRGEFIDKLTKARGAVPSGTALCSILTVPNAKKTIEVGNWILASPKIGELTVTNRDGNQQRMYIMEDLPGFIFESNRHTKHCFQAESTLGLDFVTGWAARGGGRRLRFRAEAQKAKLQELAKELWDNYLKEARMRPRDALVQLQKASSSLQEFCESHKDGSMRKSKLSEKQHVENCLRCVYEAITNETVLSTFELSISGIVSSLLSLLHVIQNNNESDAAILFRKVFSDNRSLTSLVRKMVLVLETVEKFPQYLYDTPGGSSFGLQLLSRRIKLKLEQQQNNAKSSKQKHLLDRTGRTMKTEPLTTIGQLKNYILRMVAKQWYDRDRETFAFVKLINEAKRTSSKITFTYSSDFDDQGLIYWLGTNGKTVSHWTNPASVNVVYVTSSDGNRQPYGLAEDILRPYRYLRIAQNGRNASNQTYYLSLSGFEVYGSIVDVVIEDLKPSEEKSQSGNASKKSSKKNSLSSSTVSKEKEKDSEGKSKDSFGSAATVSTTPTTTTTVTTASAHEQPTAASSFSHLAGGIANNKLISGVITADVASASSAFKTRILRYRRGSRLLVGSRGGMPSGGGASAMTTTDSSGGGGGTNTAACAIGSRVTRGPDWKWENQGSGSVGTIISPLEKGWLDVQWDDGTMNSYRFGADNKFDVHIITSDIPPPSSTSSSLQALRRVPRAIVTSRRDHHHNAAPLSTQATQQFATFTGFTPFSGRQLSTTATTTTTTTTTSASRKDEANSHARGRYASSTANPFARFYQTSNTNANFTETSSTAPSRDTKAASAGPSASSTIAQKSMSTTNLLDGSDGDKRPSVASTNQAASAESLQHPTPSLENLLARSRIYDERIAEVVADDGSATEQTPLGSSKALDTDQESSVSTNNNAAFDTSIDSFDAAFAQYAQQSINVNSSSGRVSASLEEEDVEERTEAASDTTATAQQLSANDQQGLTSVEQSLSVSAPDLAVIRQRQQQEDTYVDIAKDQQQPASKAISSTDSTAPKESAAQEPSETDVVKTSTNESEHPSNETEKLHVDVVCESDSAQQQQQEGQDEADGGDQQHTPTIKQQSSVNEISSDNNAINEISSAVDDAIRQYLMGGDEQSESDSNAVHSDDRTSGAVQSFFAITNSDGEYNDFLDAYADMLDNAGDEENPTREEATEESAKKAGDEGAEEQSVTTEISSETTAIAAADESATVTSNTTSAGNFTLLTQKFDMVRRNVQSIGGGIRYRLGNYAEVLRTVMQQVIDSGSSLNALELEELEDDIYDDDMTEEVNEEDCDDEYVNGLSVEALAQAAAALRRQSRSTSSAGSNNDLKVNWKQIVVGEAGRLLGERSSIRSSNSTDHSSSNGAINRNWDDEFVLKRQFDALIPAFDPRPGRTNVNQTQDVELPPPIKESDKVQSNASRTNVDKPKQTSSEHVHERNIRLYIRGPNLANIENVTVELNDNNASMFYFLQQLCQNIDWGQKTERTRRVWEPTYTLIYEEAIPQQPSTIETINQSNDSNDLNNSPPIVTDTLAVLADLHKLGERTGELEMNTEMFVSEKVTQKLMQELADPLIVSARALPLWCDHLIYEYPCLFSIETRTHYLHATAFGTSRAIVWLQTRRDQILEQSRGATSAAAVSNLAGARRDDHYPEFRVGRIKHERIKVPRNGDLLFESAKRVMEFHATRKSVLEVEYVGEEGTGLGPTLEFYALVAAEFQRKSLGMWVCDDLDEDQLKREENEIDLGEGVKPPGYYVRRSGGLFPAALPRHGDESKKAVELFKFLGIFLAKVLQDGRLVDLPLSTAFLKLLVSRPVSSYLIVLVNPPSSIFKFGEMELIDGGSNVGVTNDNVDLYLEKCLQFYLNSGIYEQISALRDGFNLVFPLRSLRMFTPEEVQTLLSGEQCPEWTRDDIMNYTEPKLGYTRESPGFLRFVDVLVGMTAAERKSFLQFTTGCSSLPPGGLANLHPRLTIVRKVDSGDGSYPSVNTCVHYLKLPDYSSVEIMRERLLTATNEKGFYLN